MAFFVFPMEHLFWLMTIVDVYMIMNPVLNVTIIFSKWLFSCIDMVAVSIFHYLLRTQWIGFHIGGCGSAQAVNIPVEHTKCSGNQDRIVNIDIGRSILFCIIYIPGSNKFSSLLDFGGNSE